MLDWFPAK